MRFEPQRDAAFAFVFGIIVLLLLAVIVAIWFAPATLGEKIPLILVMMVFETFFLMVWYNTQNSAGFHHVRNMHKNAAGGASLFHESA
ncbi:hypothetical protein NLX71_01630 [Paenibacillus sp. MZ04-78.2]|uniref:hypothetical protein n=1 Tax=Paenibacillus sp. MZ04-78.2 TaxID=2962034 RepID=UPI0020B73532|nr:hypothetical protein [Paenibacillus sp. MZ04-78.2]MCP3772021.1 hypothetical protein [Paenibacillus sp. MZ04-78.2]